VQAVGLGLAVTEVGAVPQQHLLDLRRVLGLEVVHVAVLDHPLRVLLLVPVRENGGLRALIDVTGTDNATSRYRKSTRILARDGTSFVYRPEPTKNSPQSPYLNAHHTITTTQSLKQS
jgi:hypothetical protein